jgi:hypothetical protein
VAKPTLGGQTVAEVLYVAGLLRMVLNGSVLVEQYGRERSGFLYYFQVTLSRFASARASPTFTRSM